MSPWEFVVLATAGLIAGMVNAVAGGGTLISFPVLLWLGMPPVQANVTSAVGLLSGYLSAAIAYRRELDGQGSLLLGLLPFSIIGGTLGAVVLLVAPDSAFRTAAPFLVLFSCGLLALQPRLSGLVQNRALRISLSRTVSTPAPSKAVRFGVLLAGIYGSYFGAGLGILLLALLGILIDDTLQRLNALKAALSLGVSLVSVVLFVLSESVSWLEAGIIFVAAAAGGMAGARVARALPAAVLRTSIILFGLAVAIVLLTGS